MNKDLFKQYSKKLVYSLAILIKDARNWNVQLQTKDYVYGMVSIIILYLLGDILKSLTLRLITWSDFSLGVIAFSALIFKLTLLFVGLSASIRLFKTILRKIIS